MALGLQPQEVAWRIAGICLLLGTSVACNRKSAPVASEQAAAIATVPDAGQKPAAPKAVDLGDPSQQFLLQTEQGQIVLATTASTASRVLAAHADASIYDPELELVWFRDGERLAVLDLRKPEPQPVVIARGLPDEHRFVIDGPTMVSTEDGCDLPWIQLTWNEEPKILTILSPAPEIRIENSAWLLAELKRAPRAVPEVREFSEERMRLPRKIQDCEDKEDCGSTLAFGAGGLQLVRAVDKEGGDCRQRSCLLYDPEARLFATPARETNWARAEATPLGPCGPHLFNRAGDTYLLERRACKLGGACHKLPGIALGWRIPGEVVGEPGLGDSPQ